MKSMIETPAADENEKMIIKEPLLDSSSEGKGGFKTMPFILANETFEKVAGNGLQPNMIMYLMKEYHLEMTTGSNILFLWTATSNFMAILGAAIADSAVGRFPMVGMGSLFSLLGMVILWLTTMIPQARPPPCNESNSICSPPTIFQLLLLCSSFGLMSIGAGGVRSTSVAFGADQLRKGDERKNARAVGIYFSWYYASFSLSIFIALSVLVYIQDNMGWKIGFGVPTMLMLLSALSFFVASPMYVKSKPKPGLITGMIQTAVASYKKRHLKLSTESLNMLYHHKKDSDLILPSEKLRFLNKACLIIDPQQDLTEVGEAKDIWSLCTTDQVEELKVLLKVIPLWSTGLMVAVTVSQGSFLVLQAKSMNRKFGSSFEFPAGSFPIFSLIGAMSWITMYHPVVLPVASKIMGKPVHLSAKQRMGLGIFASIICMIITATVETIRRDCAIREGYADDPDAVISMSAMWLIPQHLLNGFGEGVNTIAQLEFYNSELPRSMSSIASTLCLLGASMANFVGSFIFNMVASITKIGGKESWISDNVNKGHYDYYYWILTGLTMLNMIYFVYCCKAYGPCKEDEEEILDHHDG